MKETALEMKKRIEGYVKEFTPDLIKLRRDLHEYAENGFLEFRTASIVVKELEKLGFEVQYGATNHKEESMMGVPPIKEIEEAQQKAIAQGADEEIVLKMSGGKTGVMGILDTGRPGPTIGIRVDMDALGIQEEITDLKHRPVLEKFCSTTPGVMHACGHDAHTSMGLGLAKILSNIKDELNGKIKLIFQTAEEGGRGAKSMVDAGIVDDVDYMMAIHVGLGAVDGEVTCGAGDDGFPASHKLDVYFTGKPSHAGAAPEMGNNALLAAATAILNLHAISRHSGGMTRVNVGSLVTNDGRNIIPFEAKLKIETRGKDAALEEYMMKRADEILIASAKMHNCEIETNIQGMMPSAKPSKELPLIIGQIARTIPEFTKVDDFGPFGNGGGEDYTFFMERVQGNGGQATLILLGTNISDGHHTKYFDINEDVMTRGLQLLSEVIYQISNNK